MNNPINIQNRFGLRRSNFVLNPLSDEDADFFADRTGVNVGTIIEDLQIDLATGLPPKRMLWGPYGGGKTHTLQHTMKKLSELTPIYPVYIECPDLSKRSTFLELYREGQEIEIMPDTELPQRVMERIVEAREDFEFDSERGELKSTIYI